jgi:hypothetical protein
MHERCTLATLERMEILTLIWIILIGQSCVQQDTFTAILNSPDKFHEKAIEIEGILHDRKAGKAIYRVGSDTVDTRKAIAVEFSDVFMLLNTFEGGLDNKNLKIRGTFNKDDRGPKNIFAGTVEDAIIIFE